MSASRRSANAFVGLGIGTEIVAVAILMTFFKRGGWFQTLTPWHVRFVPAQLTPREIRCTVRAALRD